MITRTAIEAFFGGGSLWGYLALIGAAGIGFWMIADHYYDEGKGDCEAAQAKADDTVEGLTDAALSETATIDTEFETEKTDAETTLKAGYDAADLNRAYRDGFTAALETRQSGAIDEARDRGGCLSEPYSSDDVLRVSARSLQESIFDGGTGGDGAGPAGKVQTPSGPNALSGPPPGLYPVPD